MSRSNLEGSTDVFLLAHRTTDGRVPGAVTFMKVVGGHHLGELQSGAVAELKPVFNERGAIVFPASRQHREMKAEGISYEDNYAGNALAAMLRRDAIEIRDHQSFCDSDVARIVRTLLATPEMAWLKCARTTNQGRAIRL